VTHRRGVEDVGIKSEELSKAEPEQGRKGRGVG
jgi:hypothetical protein